jgi:hypothetical protein
VEILHRERLAAATRVPGLGFWVGFVGDAFVGWWILEPPQRPDQGPVDGQAELGYRLLRRWWRRGLASEGARELTRHGFEDLGLDRIFAETMAVNTASRATMASVGLRQVRTFPLTNQRMDNVAVVASTTCALTGGTTSATFVRTSPLSRGGRGGSPHRRDHGSDRIVRLDTDR